MEDLKDKFRKAFPETIFDEKLSKHTTFQIGGPADCFYAVSDNTVLPELLKFARDHQIKSYILGAGSNTLFDDQGFRGLIIKIETKNIEILEGNFIKADSGVSIPSLIKFTVDNDLQGLERWVGLPGTVGGAVRGNAGCNGLETQDILVSAEVIDQNLKLATMVNSYFDFTYRFSRLKKTKEVVLSAIFRVEALNMSKDEQREMMSEIKQTRMKVQPFGSTTGSFFKNPDPSHPAGKLIEEVGLKGKQIGNAQISGKHGNFFLNLGGAKSREIIALANMAKEEVKAKFHLNLEQEVQYLPENGL